MKNIKHTVRLAAVFAVLCTAVFALSSCALFTPFGFITIGDPDVIDFSSGGAYLPDGTVIYEDDTRGRRFGNGEYFLKIEYGQEELTDAESEVKRCGWRRIGAEYADDEDFETVCSSDALKEFLPENAEGYWYFENISEPDSPSDQAEIPENFPDGTPDGFTFCLLDTNKRMLYVYELVR